MRALVRRAFDAAIEAVDATRSTRVALEAAPIRGGVHVLALGKAALGMAAGAIEACDVVSGLVVAPEGAGGPALPASIEVLRGAHPVPDADVARRGEALLARAAAIPPTDTALVLISGGGSALVDAPAPGIRVEALARLTRALLASGARIEELNAIRVALSRSKGGGLARALGTSSVRALVISDVTTDPSGQSVASGPMSAWRGESPHDVAERPHVAAALDADVRAALARWRAVPTPPFALEVVADNDAAVRAAREALEAAGLRVGDGPRLEGEARAAGERWASAASSTRADALVAGGETTVTLRGRGRGGRSQEVVLAALLAGMSGTFLCAGTDGIDGPTDAAGARLDGSLLFDRDAAARALAGNDAYGYFAPRGGLLHTGPTGTNVADVAIWAR